MESGEFATTSEVVREAMRRYTAYDDRVEALRREIQKGIDSGPHSHSTGMLSWNESSAPKAMHNIVVHPEAEVDIEDAADYTIEQGGRDQAPRYVGDIPNVIDRLAINGLRYPEEWEAYPGLRRMRSGHHFIFFLIEDEKIDVVRVMHERRDAVRHLTD